MDTMWLAWDGAGDGDAARREVAVRDPDAPVLSVRDVAAAIEAAHAFHASWDAVDAMLASSDAAELERAVGRFAASGSVDRIVAVAACLDPAHAARLFRSGATEVIAGERTASLDMDRNDGACERGTGAMGPARPSSCDDATGPGVSGAAGGAARCERLAAGAGAPPGRIVGAWCADDLDEPDGDAWDAAASDPVRVERASGSRPGSMAGAGGVAVAAGSEGCAAPAEPAGALAQLAATACPVAPGTQPSASPDDTGVLAANAPRAPLVAAVSGRGGCGVSTIVASMALVAAAAGLRCAVLDLDLMFGNIAVPLGAEQTEDLAALVAPARAGCLTEAEIAAASVRVRPGVTLWGPVRAPEQAELVGGAVERLIGTLRREADVIFADTSTYWSDASAAAIAQCDRCLIVGGREADAAPSAARAIELVGRIGVPRTRMTSVFNRCSHHEDAEDAAARFEFVCSLSSRERIADAGRELGELAVIGQLPAYLERSGPFQEGVRAMTQRVLAELGCPIELPEAARPHAGSAGRHRLRLPWFKMAGDAA